MNEQELQQAFIQFLAQKTGAKSQQELEAIIQQMGEEGLKQAYAEFMQVMQQQQVRAAKFGAKLNYIKQLRGQCPDGYEVKYFKNGGGMTEKRCVACQKGQEIPEPTNAIEAFKCGRKTKKKACGGDIKKGQQGTDLFPKRMTIPQSIDEMQRPSTPGYNRNIPLPVVGQDRPSPLPDKFSSPEQNSTDPKFFVPNNIKGPSNIGKRYPKFFTPNKKQSIGPDQDYRKY